MTTRIGGSREQNQDTSSFETLCYVEDIAAGRQDEKERGKEIDHFAMNGATLPDHANKGATVPDHEFKGATLHDQIC